MPDEISMGEDTEEAEAIPPIVHDDIMQRLLDYQRQLREDLTPERAAEPNAPPILVDRAALVSPTPSRTQTDTVEVIEVLEVIDAGDAEPKPAAVDAVPQIWADSGLLPEPTPMPTTPASSNDVSGDLAAHLAELEDSLSGVAKSVGDLRAQFRNMVIAADDRLAAIESKISSAKDEAAAP